MAVPDAGAEEVLTRRFTVVSANRPSCGAALTRLSSSIIIDDPVFRPTMVLTHAEGQKFGGWQTAKSLTTFERSASTLMFR